MRKSRAGLAQAEKGLNLAVISVMNLVIIVADVKSAYSLKMLVVSEGRLTDKCKL